VKRNLLDRDDGVVLVDSFEDARGSSSTDETELLVRDSFDLGKGYRNEGRGGGQIAKREETTRPARGEKRRENER